MISYEIIKNLPSYVLIHASLLFITFIRIFEVINKSYLRRYEGILDFNQVGYT